MQPAFHMDDALRRTWRQLVTWPDSGPPDPTPNRAFDFVVDGSDELAEQVFATLR